VVVSILSIPSPSAPSNHPPSGSSVPVAVVVSILSAPPLIRSTRSILLVVQEVPVAVVVSILSHSIPSAPSNHPPSGSAVPVA